MPEPDEKKAEKPEEPTVEPLTEGDVVQVSGGLNVDPRKPVTRRVGGVDEGSPGDGWRPPTGINTKLS